MDRGRWSGRGDGGMCSHTGKYVWCYSYSSEPIDFFYSHFLQRNLKHEMFVGRRMGKAYYFLIGKRFVVHSRLRNKQITRTHKEMWSWLVECSLHSQSATARQVLFLSPVVRATKPRHHNLLRAITESPI